MILTPSPLQFLCKINPSCFFSGLRAVRFHARVAQIQLLCKGVAPLVEAVACAGAGSAREMRTCATKADSGSKCDERQAAYIPGQEPMRCQRVISYPTSPRADRSLAELPRGLLSDAESLCLSPPLNCLVLPANSRTCRSRRAAERYLPMSCPDESSRIAPRTKYHLPAAAAFLCGMNVCGG
jgi:hypothetical protein